MTATPIRSRERVLGSLQTTLVEIPSWFESLSLFRLPSSRTPDASGVRGVSDPARPPVDLDLLDLEDGRLSKSGADAVRDDFDLDRRAGARRQGILPTLVAWVRLVDGEMWDQGVDHDPPGAQIACSGHCVIVDPAPSAQGPCTDNLDRHTLPATVAGECSWLCGHLAWIMTRTWVDELAAELERILKDIRRACGDASVDETLTCLKDGCGWAVEEISGGAWFRCRGCGSAWSRMELHKRAERKKPISLAECARRAGVTERTLHNYRADGRITPTTRRGRRDLYDLDEVMTATMSLRYRQKRTA